MQKSEQIDLLAKALVAAQLEMESPKIDSVNPHFKNRYASLGAVLDATKPALLKHGLALVQWPMAGEKGPRLASVLLHASGQWMEFEALELPASKPDAQGHGSALSYSRRYTWQAICGVTAEEDDDAQAAVRSAPQQRQGQEQAAAPAASQPPQPGPEHLKKLRDLMTAKGISWERVRDGLQMPAKARMEDMSPPEYREALRRLREHPDAAQPAGAASAWAKALEEVLLRQEEGAP